MKLLLLFCVRLRILFSAGIACLMLVSVQPADAVSLNTRASITGETDATAFYAGASESPTKNQIRSSAVPAYAKASPDLFAGASLGTAWPLESGYIVTNNHVISDCTDVLLVDRSGRQVRAWAVARDEINDIALLETSHRDKLPPALPLSHQQAGLGASVFTIGYPRIDVLGRSPKLSNGIISSANGLRDNPATYQITVPIQPGNSGGPLLNMNGEVVGMIKSMIGIRDDSGSLYTLQNTSCALKVDPIRRLLGHLPHQDPILKVLPRTAENLELLARRIQDSVLIVVAR